MTMITTRPQPAPARAYHFPRFYRREIGNGLRLIVAPIHKLPIVTFLAVVDAGAVAEPVGKEGVALLTARALTEGAGGLDGEAFTEQLERLGTSLDTNADWDDTTVSMTVLSRSAPEAFARFADVVTAPAFPDAAIERLKAERLAEILQVEAEPREYADDMFSRFLYNHRSRFRTPTGGNRLSVSSLTRRDVLDFYEARYRPDETTLIIAGDLSVDDAVAMAEKALQGWKGRVAAAASTDDSPSRTKRSIHVVQRGDAPQSELRIGNVGVSREHRDYFEITVMNAIFGGLFGSRVNLNLREAHGYTYGARSVFDWRRGAGPFVISTAVASDVTGAAIKETLYEIDRIRQEAVSEHELSLATDYLDGVFPIRYETTAAVAQALAVLVVYGLADDWYDTYRARIRAVSTADVLRVAQEHIHPDQLQIVVLGDAGVVREQLESLQFSPVTVHNE